MQRSRGQFVRISPSRSGAASIRAFTLVELLIVIGIIAVLVAILLPMLSRARQAANLVKCSANLRSIGQACMMYANDNRDHWPDPGEPNLTKFRIGTLSNYGTRRGLGVKKIDDPSSYPEWLGLPSVLHGVRQDTFDRSTHSQTQVEAALARILPKPRYLLGTGGVWVCPSAPEPLAAYGNTYSWNTSDDLIKAATSKKRAPRADGKGVGWNTTYVFDNRTQIPYLPGFILAGTATGYNQSPTWPFPHRLNKDGKINQLHIDGHVGLSGTRN